VEARNTAAEEKIDTARWGQMESEGEEDEEEEEEDEAPPEEEEEKDMDMAHESYLNTLEGEIAFFRSLMRARPVGIHRHFHALVIRSTIQRDTGRWLPMDDIWEKLKGCYDLDLLEGIEIDGFDVPGSGPRPGSNGNGLRSPSPHENLASHPYFRAEYTLPDDSVFEDIISRRRMRASVSTVGASPAPSHTYQDKTSVRSSKSKSKRSRAKEKEKEKNKMAGLVGGDSDSSALTQESGDESIGVAPTPAGTDGATEYNEGDGEHEQSPETASSSKPSKKGPKTGAGRRNSNATAMATRAKAPPPTRGGIKKKKR